MYISLPLQELAQDKLMYFYTRFYILVSSLVFFLNVSWMLLSSLLWRHLNILGQLSTLTIQFKDRESQQAFQTLS